VDERSDDEEDEEDVTMEDKPKINGTNPVVLINGAPVEGEAQSDGVRERKRRG